MSSRKTQIPAIPVVSVTDPASVARAHDAIKEVLEVAHGRRGDPLDRFVSLRELQEAGIGRVSNGALIGGQTGSGNTGGAGVFDPGPPDFGDTDFAVPPAPTGVAARGVGPDGMMITWNQPGYRNHAYAEVFSVAVPNELRPTPTVAINPTPQSTLQQAAPAFVWTRPVSQSNAHPRYVGFADGVVFLQRGISRAAPELPNPIDSQLHPPAFRYFVRFVSTAGVPGPLAPVPQGATGVMAVNPTDVLDAMTRAVEGTAVYQELRRVINLSNLTPAEMAELAARGSLTRFALSRDAALRQEIVRLTGDPGQWPAEFVATNQTLSSVSIQSRNNLRNLWTVRMNQSVGGATYAAGFGLGIETDLTNGQSLSTFAISANQFVVSGPTTPFFRVVALAALQSGLLQLTVASPIPGGITATKFAVSAVDVADSPDPDFVVARAVSGLEGDAFYNVGSQTVVLSRAAGWGLPVGFSFTEAQCRKVGLSIVGPQSIPFIIDTQRQVVGIRGSLIVDGLVRSQVGDFDNLAADNAFINHLRAQTVNANVVIGQRIIAGVPAQSATGQIGDGAISQVSNYIVELSNPGDPSNPRSPFRYYRPNPFHSVAELDRFGNLRIGGNLEVGQNAVVNTTDGSHLVSIGGPGADPGRTFPLWIGLRTNYGPNGSLRRSDNAILAVRSDGEVSFDADILLRGDPLTVPTSTGVIQVQAPRSGLARVFLSAQLSIAPDPESDTRAAYDVYLGLLPETGYTSRGLGVEPFVRNIGYWAQGPDGVVTEPTAARAILRRHVELVNSAGGAAHALPGPAYYLAARAQVDANNGTMDLKNITIQGSVVVPPATARYRVFVSILRKHTGSAFLNTAPHGVFTGSFFAQQTRGIAGQ